MKDKEHFVGNINMQVVKTEEVLRVKEDNAEKVITKQVVGHGIAKDRNIGPACSKIKPTTEVCKSRISVIS